MAKTWILFSFSQNFPPFPKLRAFCNPKKTENDTFCTNFRLRFDATLKIWNLNSEKCIQTLVGHDHAVFCCAFSRRNQILSGSGDHTLRLWDIETGKTLRVFRGYKSYVNTCAIGNFDEFFSGSRDKTLRLWDIKNSDRSLLTFRGHQREVSSVAIEDEFVISGSVDKTLRLWDIKNGTCLRIFKGHDLAITACYFTKDGRFLMSVSADKSARIWNIHTGNCIDVKCEHEHGIWACALSHDESFIVCTSCSRNLRHVLKVNHTFDWWSGLFIRSTSPLFSNLRLQGTKKHIYEQCFKI